MAKKKKTIKSKKEKGQEWKHDHVSGSAHPDNKPPLQMVAQASDEAAEKETQALNAIRQKEIVPDWSALPGGKPADPSKPAAETPPPKRTRTTAKAKVPATDVVAGGPAVKGTTGVEKK